MALKKLIETPSGHTCEYWRVVGVHQDHILRTGKIVLVGYRDKEARDKGKLPLGDATFVVEAYLGHDSSTPAAYGFLVQHRKLIEAECEHHDATTGESWTQPAKYELGPLYGATIC